MRELQRPATRRADTLLHTKLMPPRLPSGVVARPTLFARLDEGLAKPLILITAPTGFGKSTLVAAWTAARDFASAWVMLDENDNDPVRFWTYVISALRTLDRSVGKSTLAALRASPPAPLPAVLTALLNDLERLAPASVLVLEDYHAITSAEIQASMAFFVQHLPASLHLVLVARSQPALPLAILRARDELAELDAASLRFSLAETEAFLHQAALAYLPASAAASLQARTEGWAAGLRLAVRALHGLPGREDAEKFIQSFSGTHRYVADYLIQEVFESQPEPVQSFLLQTCFLDRLTGSLCEAVTQAGDGAVMLAQLERDNLFIVPLRDGGEQVWYRYNPLFAESIQGLARRRLGEAGVRVIYERASGWYVLHGYVGEAIEAALAAGLYERAMPLIERYLEIHSLAQAYTLTRWLERIPAALVQSNPALSFAQAQIILYTADRYAPSTPPRLEPLLQAAEAAWQAGGDTGRLGTLHSFRGLVAWWQGDLPKAFELAHQSLEEIPEQEVTFRGSSLLLISYEALNAGRVLAAQNHALEARALLGAAQNQYGVLAAMQMLSEAFYWQGELEQADQLNRQILAEADEQSGGESMLDNQGIASLGHAATAYERNELDSAEDWAARSLDLAQRRGNQLLEVQATARLARLQAARGNLSHAEALLKAAEARVENPAWLRLVQAELAWLAICSQQAGGLDGWLALISVSPEKVLPTQQEQEIFILARLRLLQGQPAQALELLAGRPAEAAAQGRLRSQVEALLLEALAQQAGAGPERAIKPLIQALQLGQAHGYRRLFLDEGAAAVALLQAALPRLSSRPLNLYAAALLHSFSPGLAAGTGQGVLIEPLSQQELRVLRLLINGLSNAEIARQLVVSTNTVKTQVQSIYRKLDVNSRQEASQVARELKLL